MLESLGPDTGAKKFDHAVKRVVEIMGMGVAVAGLEVRKSVERRTKRSGRVHPVVVVEIEPRQRRGDDADDALNRLFELGITCAGVTIGRLIEPGVRRDYAPPGPSYCGHCLIAGHADRRFGQRSSELISPAQTEQPQQILVALNVAIERRLSHTEFICHPGQRQGVEAIGVRDDRGRVDNPVLVKGPSRRQLVAAKIIWPSPQG